MQRLLLFLLILFTAGLMGQSMDKKYRTIAIERQIEAPAERVWEALVADYGEISNFSPFIYTSNYLQGSLKGEVGARRKCAFNAKGTQWTHEEIREIDADRMLMKNVVIDAQKFPLDTDNSYATYHVRDNGDGTSTAGYTFHFRTKPAFLGLIARGSFKKSLNETLIGLEHYLETGEHVTGGSDNAERVIKAYRESGAYGNYVEPEEPVSL